MAGNRDVSPTALIKAGSAEFMRQRHALMAFILLLVRDPHAAEDIFQDVWVSLVDALGKGTSIDDLSKWCRGVARNKVRALWREQGEQGLVFDSRLLDHIEIAFEESNIESKYWGNRRDALSACIEQLPDRSRLTLSLRYDSGLSMAALADRLDRTVTVVTKTLSRIRAMLEQCVERKLVAESPS